MERVQFQQEQMLPELKDLVQKGLFTEEETKHILKRHTQFETALVRRIAKKNDFLRYAAYEMQLETLRKKRAQRLHIKGPPSISDYAFVRRQFQVFERALKKFHSDIGLWIEYIKVAQREGARALVGRITARALQLHPNTPSLYILAAQHELRHLSPSAARVLLQRGIRLNADSVEIWREYVRMELGFIETLRRRWNTLGIDLNTNDTSHEVDEEEADSEETQQAIMSGAIVKEVISAAAKALPKLELFTELAYVIRTYPLPTELREALLDHLYERLTYMLPCTPDAVRMRATRALDTYTDDVPQSNARAEGGEAGEKTSNVSRFDNEAFIDALQSANEEFVKFIRAMGYSSGVTQVYAEFVETWCSKLIDESLKRYLITALGALVRKVKRSDSSLPIAHEALYSTMLRLLAERVHVDEPLLSADRLRTLACKCVEASRHAPSVWLARLEVEQACGDQALETWREARRRIMSGLEGGKGREGWERDALMVWTWGLDHLELREDEKENEVENMLGESMSDGALRKIHDTLSIRYVSLGGDDYGSRVEKLAKRSLPSTEAWQAIFDLLCACGHKAADSEGTGRVPWMRVLKATHTHWMDAGGGADATIAWAEWLLDHNHGTEAIDVIQNGTDETKRRWAEVLRLREERRDGDDSDGDSVGEDGV